jgi:hypothetical protein
VLEWDYTGNGLHPTQKPVMAMLPLILAFSRGALGDSYVSAFWC